MGGRHHESLLAAVGAGLFEFEGSHLGLAHGEARLRSAILAEHVLPTRRQLAAVLLATLALARVAQMAELALGAVGATVLEDERTWLASADSMEC